MSHYFSVAEYFFKQNRFKESLEQVQKGLHEDPQNTILLAFQALCQLKMKLFQASETSLKQALTGDPNSDFSHYIYASLELERGRFKPSEKHIRHAIDINPINAEYYGILALTLYNRHRSLEEIKEVVKTGLSFDPHNNVCRNVLAMAELRKGKKKLATDIMHLQLEKEPGNSLSLANQGWNFVHNGEYDKAETLFAQALQEEPYNEWARSGLLQAYKARLPLYKYLLKYFLFLSRLSPVKRFGFIFGIYILIALVARSGGALGEVAGAGIILYAGLIFATWLGESLANLALAHLPHSKHLIRKEEKRNSYIVSGFLLATLLLGIGYLLGSNTMYLVACTGCFLLSIPLTIILQEENKVRQRWYLGILGGLFASGLGVLFFPQLTGGQTWGGAFSVVSVIYLCVVVAFTSVLFFFRR